MLNKYGVPFVKVDDWYDYDVGTNKIKVEVKSTRICIKNIKKETKKFGIKAYKRTGKFNFGVKNRGKLYKNNVWIAFVVRYPDGQGIILGFIKSRKIKINKHRYISMLNVIDNGVIYVEDWLNIYTKKDIKNKDGRK